MHACSAFICILFLVVFKVPCVCDSSSSFILILFKHYRCLDDALKICMWFGYNPQTNFDTFYLNLVFFRHL